MKVFILNVMYVTCLLYKVKNPLLMFLWGTVDFSSEVKKKIRVMCYLAYFQEESK